MITEETRRKMSESAKNRPSITEETRKKLSIASSGRNNGMYNRKHKPESIKKMSENSKGCKGSFCDKKHKPETLKKMSENNARYWKDKTFSDEHRRKIGEANKGGKRDEETKKKMSEIQFIVQRHRKGKPGTPHSEETKNLLSEIAQNRDSMSQETKDKISKTSKKRWEDHPEYREELSIRMSKTQLGKNNPNWKGGITSENIEIRTGSKYKEWRKKVLIRDNHICQKCYEKSLELCSHHVKNFSSYKKLRFVIDNGITFCSDCHNKFHIIYGSKNNNKKQVNNFIKDKR